MFEIVCPHCGKTISEDESKFASIVKQVRDHEFSHEVEERMKLVESERESAQKAAVADALKEAEAAAAREREGAARELAQTKEQLNAQLAEQREKSSRLMAQQREQAAAELAEEHKKAADELAALRAKASDELAALREKAASDAEQAARAALAAQAERDEKIAQLEASLKAAGRENELATKNALAEASARIAELEMRLKNQEESAQQAQRIAEAEFSARSGQLEARLKAQEDAAKHEQELAVMRVQTELSGKLEEAKHAASLAEAKLSEQKAESDRRYREMLSMKDDELARYKEMRSQLSTKLIGEALEQHCQSEFNRIRTTAFPHAEFHKDNEAVEGTKGDFIFRDFSDDGIEIISIMFEMKTEEEGSSEKNRKTNESHLKKLDRDRNKKGCEYAVLVSELERDNELYNQGIVDVSYLYPKMYVIRPQFFIPLITLLYGANLKTVESRRELARMQAESIDITNFEARLGTFKNEVAKSYDLAVKKFEWSMDEIDKAIAILQGIKKAFGQTEDRLGAIDKKTEKLTIRALTSKSPSLRQKFKELAEVSEELDPDEIELPQKEELE